MTDRRSYRLAILDDYQGIAAAKFSHLHARITFLSYGQTLNSYDPGEKEALIDRLEPYDIISTMRERTPLPADVISRLPNLKYVLTSATRNRAIDLDACAKRGILVTGTTGRGREQQQPPEQQQTADGFPVPTSTVQHTWALILGLARHIARDDEAVKRGEWQGSLATGLGGKTLGLLGLGRLGTAVAKIGALAFGMKIKAWSSSLTQDVADENATSVGLEPGTFEVVDSKEELFRTADVLSIHYVLSQRSVGIVGKEELAVMKPTALLVNTSRGPLVDETALLDTLKRGKIRGAALDVFDTEPLLPKNEWSNTSWGEDGRSEVLLTPHMGYCDEETMNCWYEEQVENLEMWLDGKTVRTKL